MSSDGEEQVSEAPAQPILPTSYQPKPQQAEGGTAKIKVNPTQLSDQMCHPVESHELPSVEIGVVR